MGPIFRAKVSQLCANAVEIAYHIFGGFYE
jgi:hypothetical protein